MTDRDRTEEPGLDPDPREVDEQEAETRATPAEPAQEAAAEGDGPPADPVETSLPDPLPGEVPHLDPEEVGGMSEGSFREAGATPLAGDRRKLGGVPRRDDLTVPPEELGSRILEEATETDPDHETG